MLPTHCRLAALAAIAAIAVAAWNGCGGGEIEITLHAPELEALSPLGDDLAEITLRASAAGQELGASVAVVDDGGPVALGRLPENDDVEVRVELRGQNQRLIGYGRSAPFTVDGGGASIDIEVRRPFAYVTGTDSILTLDGSLDRTGPYRTEIASLGGVQAIASTPDGADLVVAANDAVGGLLYRIPTDTHESPDAGQALEIAGDVTDIAISRDGQLVVIGHGGAGGGVSVVDLAALRGGDATPRFAALGDVGRVAISGGVPDRAALRVFALIGRAVDFDCPAAPPSQIVEVDPRDPESNQVVIAADAPLADMAAAARDDRLLVADACAGAIRLLDPDDDIQRADLAPLPLATAVAIVGDRAYGVGVQAISEDIPAQFELVTIRLDGTDESRLPLAALQEQVVFDDEPGQQGVLRMSADRLLARDLAIAPGGQHIALLTREFYSGNTIFGSFEIFADEYLLIDAASGALVHRIRTSCDNDIGSCDRAPDQDTADPEFPPRNVAFLYGDR